MKLIKTSITETAARMRYADNEDAATAKFWIDFQVPLNELKKVAEVPLRDPGLQYLATTQQAALRYARNAIDDEIERLRRLRDQITS